MLVSTESIKELSTEELFKQQQKIYLKFSIFAKKKIAHNVFRPHKIFSICTFQLKKIAIGIHSVTKT